MNQPCPWFFERSARNYEPSWFDGIARASLCIWISRKERIKIFQIDRATEGDDASLEALTEKPFYSTCLFRLGFLLKKRKKKEKFIPFLFRQLYL